MRNAANKMTNPIDPYTENHFLSFIEISERNGSLCGSHSSSLWLSLAQKALARLATSQLHSSSLSHSGTDMWISAFKIFLLPVPSRPATRSFCHYPTRSRPEVKNHYPSVSVHHKLYLYKSEFIFVYLAIGKISFDVLGPWAFHKYSIIRVYKVRWVWW